MKKNKLAICKSTRKIAADTLLIVLKEVLNTNRKVSEAEFRDKWLQEMRKYKQVFSNGWYEPPPSGIVVLFSSKQNPYRADFKNLRPKEYWPKKDIYFKKDECFAYLFASPTDKQTGLAGDFAINIYLGKDSKVINHINTSLRMCRDIFDFIKVGMTFSEIFQFASMQIKKNGLRNNIISITAKDGENIGHTIPASYEDWSSEELKTLQNAEKNWDAFKKMLSNKRVFESKNSSLKVKPGMAFTIEPGVKVVGDETIPMTMFHQTVLIRENGEKEWLTNFDEIFKLTGMNYMLQ